MADQPVQQQLQAQLAEQSEALESLAALLAAEPNEDLQQVHYGVASSQLQSLCLGHSICHCSPRQLLMLCSYMTSWLQACKRHSSL